jgi:hypothetical protein
MHHILKASQAANIALARIDIEKSDSIYGRYRGHPLLAVSMLHFPCSWLPSGWQSGRYRRLHWKQPSFLQRLQHLRISWLSIAPKRHMSDYDTFRDRYKVVDYPDASRENESLYPRWSINGTAVHSIPFLNSEAFWRRPALFT